MNGEQSGDAVDRIITQWQEQRPDLNTAPMATIGRLKRSAALIEKRLNATFGEFGLSCWEFDVLATLRRSGPPFRLAPTELFFTLMITSGTMTHRLKQLEAKEWITRVANPEDARSMLVQLTDAGMTLIDQAVEAHVANEQKMLDGLTEQQRALLDNSLRDLLVSLE